MFGAPLIRKLVELALAEDCVDNDITSCVTVPVEHRSSARVVAREELVVCGLDLVPLIIEVGGWSITSHRCKDDGVVSRDGETLVELSGSTREILAAERTILNFLQRLSGVATFTRSFVAGQSGITILDTRKTIPGWRLLDKYAVKIGGASNHRLSLSDMILIKNNHIDAHPGGIRGALEAAVRMKPLAMPWEVEVRSLAELKVAVEFNPTIVMLDNFPDALLPEAVKCVRDASKGVLIEVSGGVSAERVALIKRSGVDAVSVGALTTKAPNVDISMRVFAQ